MAKSLQCAKEEVLVPAAEAGGIADVMITHLSKENLFVLSVRILRTKQQIFLSTRRNQHEPRTFKSADAAIAVACKLFGVKQLTVIIR